VDNGRNTRACCARLDLSRNLFPPSSESWPRSVLTPLFAISHRPQCDLPRNPREPTIPEISYTVERGPRTEPSLLKNFLALTAPRWLNRILGTPGQLHIFATRPFQDERRSSFTVRLPACTHIHAGLVPAHYRGKVRDRGRKVSLVDKLHMVKHMYIVVVRHGPQTVCVACRTYRVTSYDAYRDGTDLTYDRIWWRV